MTSNRIVIVAVALLSCFISSIHAEVVSQPILAKPIVLEHGKAWTSSLIKCSSRPAILYLKGRIPADKEGKGGHALSIELNGTLLTPDNVTILNNKQKVFRLIKHGDENKDTWDIDVFDGANSSWYLIKDNDYLPEFNDDWLCQSRMFLSNYYEHLLLVPAKLLGESNQVVLRNTHSSQAIGIQDTQTSRRWAASSGRLAGRDRPVARLESAGWADGAGNGIEAIARGSGRARGASQPHREDAEKR